MAAFGALISGAGQAAGDYSTQVRNHLESRRHDLAAMIGDAATTESDPETRYALMDLGTQLHSGKDLGAITLAFSKLAQKRAKSHQQFQEGLQGLHQLIGQPAQPKSTVGTPAGPGEVPGTTVRPALSTGFSAAQPGANPISGPAPMGLADAVAGDQGPSLSAPPQPAPVQPTTATPTAASPAGVADLTALTTPRSAQDIIASMISNPAWAAPANRPALQAATAAEINRNLELQNTLATRQMDLNERKAALAQIKSSPEWESLPALTRSQFEAWAHTHQAPLPTISTGLLRPISQRVDVDRLDPAERARLGIPADAKGFYTVRTDILTGQPIDANPLPMGIGTGYDTNTGQIATFNKGTGSPAGIVPLGMAGPVNTGVGPGGANVYVPRFMLGQPGVAQGVNPAMLPTQGAHEVQIQTVDANGNPITRLVTVPTTNQKVPPGALVTPGTPASAPVTKPGVVRAPIPAASGAGGRTFERGLTPLQNLTETQKLEQYHTAIDRANRVINNIHLLDSMIDAGKMELQLKDGVLANIVNRNVNLTDAERQMVNDFNSLRESVNLVRGPLAATGFRGPEAFAALQAQRGNLLSRPEVTRGALQTFIQEIRNQANPIAEKLHKSTTSGGAGSAPSSAVQSLIDKYKPKAAK